MLLMHIWLELWGGTPAPVVFDLLPLLRWAFWIDVAVLLGLVWRLDWCAMRDGRAPRNSD